MDVTVRMMCVQSFRLYVVLVLSRLRMLSPIVWILGFYLLLFIWIVNEVIKYTGGDAYNSSRYNMTRPHTLDVVVVFQ